LATALPNSLAVVVIAPARYAAPIEAWLSHGDRLTQRNIAAGGAA